MTIPSPELNVYEVLDAAQQLAAQHDAAAAAGLLARWLSAHGSSPMAFAVQFNLGVQLVAAGRFPEAEVAYRAAVAARPDFAPAHLNLGLLLQVLARPEEALNCWSVMLGCLDPASEALHYARGLNQLGDLLAALGRAPQAQAMYARSLAHDAAQPDIAARHAALASGG